jgi:outer membrane protein insertion porin family
MFRHCVLAALMLLSSVVVAQAQDTTVTSVDPELENIFTQRIPKEYIVASVTVTGNKYFDQQLLLSIANLNVGDKIMLPGGDNFAKTINLLWSQNYFSNVAIYILRLEKPNKLHLEIEVQERPRLQKFTFTGVKKGDIEDLQTKSGLVSGRIITEHSKQLAIDAIVKFYQEKGFRNVSVGIQEIPSKTVPNAADLVFAVDRGTKVKVGNIFVGGNTEVPDLKIKRQMKGTKEMTRITLFPVQDTPVLVPIKRTSVDRLLQQQGFLQPTVVKNSLDEYFRFKPFSSAKFNQQKYTEDKEKILDYYNTLGFRDARIVKDTTYMKNGHLNVELMMSEGRRYYFGNMTFRGNTKYSDSILQVLMNIKRGDVYNKETLNKALGKQLSADGSADISALYMDDGYLFFRAEANETAVYNDTIDHEIRLFEGPQATIKNILISGNEKTKEYVIRRELRTIPGEKFSRQDLIRSQREIANLNYFNQENIGITPVPDMNDGTVDIKYTVEEKSSDQLELSAGWGGGIGLTGTLGVTFNNFSVRNIFKRETWDPLPSGDGQRLSLRLQSNGRAFRSYNFSFTEPWLGGRKRNAFTVSLFDTKFSNAFNPLTGQFERNPSSFIRTTGASVSLGRQLKWPDDFFSLSTAISYTRYRLQNYPNFFPGLSNGVSNNLNIRLALQRSSIDQPLFPRSGSNFLASVALTPPWSLFDGNKTFDTPEERYRLIEYHKWRFTGEWYVPLSRPHGAERNKQVVLKLAAKYGFIGRYNSNLEISPFERFQVGDAGLTNQFALIGFDVIAHRGYPVYQTSDPKVNPDQQGASQYFTIFNKYTAEIRYPLSLNPSSTIFALGFMEAANGWYDIKDYNPFRLRRSVGLGMRFFLPMFGLLGFDYGVGLDRLQPGNGLRDATRFTFMLGFEPD